MSHRNLRIFLVLSPVVFICTLLLFRHLSKRGYIIHYHGDSIIQVRTPDGSLIELQSLPESNEPTAVIDRWPTIHAPPIPADGPKP